MTALFEREYTTSKVRIKWTCPLQNIPDINLLKNIVKRLVSTNENVRKTAYLAARDLIKHSKSDFLIKSMRHGGLSSIRTVFYEADPFAQNWNGIAACMNLVKDLVAAGPEIRTYLLSRWQLLLRPLKLQYEALNKMPVYSDLSTALNNEEPPSLYANSNSNNASEFQEHIRDFYQKLKPQIPDDPTKNLQADDMFAFSEFLRTLETIFLTAQDTIDKASAEELFQSNKLLDPLHTNVVFEEGKLSYTEGDILPGPRLDYSLEEDRLEEKKLGTLPYAEDFVVLADNNLRSIQLFNLAELPIVMMEQKSAPSSMSTEKPLSGTKCEPQKKSRTKTQHSLGTQARNLVRTAVQHIAGELSDPEIANTLEREISEEAAIATSAQSAIKKALESVSLKLDDPLLTEKLERAISTELSHSSPANPNPSLESDINDTASTEVCQTSRLAVPEAAPGTGVSSVGSQTTRSSAPSKGSGARMTNFNKLTPLTNPTLPMVVQGLSGTGISSSPTAPAKGACSPSSCTSPTVEQKVVPSPPPTVAAAASFKGSAPLEGRRRKFTKKMPKPSPPEDDTDLESSDAVQPMPCIQRSRAVVNTRVFQIRRGSSCSRTVQRRSLESSASTVNAF